MLQYILRITNILVCDAYIVQQPLITPIYINGLFQTNKQHTVLIPHQRIFIPINIFSLTLYTIRSRRQILIFTFMQYISE